MRRALLVWVALIGAAGCDDPAVTEKVSSVLEHGALAASAKCTIDVTYTCSGRINFSGASVLLVQKFVDGSVLFSSSLDSGSSEDPGVSRFCGRSEDCANPPTWRRHVNASQSTEVAVYTIQDGLVTVTVDGVVSSVFCGGTPKTFFVDEVEDVCTGFNLEAFGVE